MASIREVMTKDPVALSGDSPVLEAARCMQRDDIGDVIVLDGDKASGILTDRDITVRLVAEGKDPSATKISEICSTGLETLGPDASVGDAVRLMTDKDIRRLPIIENGKPVGIVSLGDLAVSHDSDSGLADISAAPPNN